MNHTLTDYDALVEALRLIAQQKTWNECYSSTPQLRKTKSDLSCELDTAIETARRALDSVGLGRIPPQWSVVYSPSGAFRQGTEHDMRDALAHAPIPNGETACLLTPEGVCVDKVEA